jgi:type IX secretion system PorP/SprF family membrane protein
MKKSLGLCLLLLSAVWMDTGLMAQQDPQFTQNFATKLFNNPAYAGAREAICVTGVFRQQWLGFDGSPQDILATAHSPINLPAFKEIPLLRPAVGISFVNDKIGPLSTTGIKLALANHFNFQRFGTISFGIGVGTQGTSIDGSEFVTPEGEVAGVITDPSLTNTKEQKKFGIDFDLGLYYRSTDRKIWAGASAVHLTQGQVTGEEKVIKDPNDTSKSIKQQATYQISSHFYFMGGYNYDLNANWRLMPMAFVKTDFNSTQLDINVRALWKEMLWGGISYRLQDAVSPMVGYQRNVGKTGSFQIGASYDVTTSKLRTASSGTIEFFGNYCMRIVPKPKVTIYKNPLWL